MKGQNKKKMLRKVGVAISSTALCCCLSLTAVLPSWQGSASAETQPSTQVSNVNKIDTKNLNSHIEDYYDSSVVQRLPESVSENQELSVIVKNNKISLLDSFNKNAKVSASYSVGEYAQTKEGATVATNIQKENERLQAKLARAGVQYELGNSYDVLLGGFEVTIKASAFDKLCDALGDSATPIIGDVYERCETQVVTNDVNVYDTGIFNSSEFEYDGSGVVVAVLDTGLDYTHSAFDPARFTGEEVLTKEVLTQKLTQKDSKGFTAAQTTANLTAEDVYVNKKVPYAYDYADKDVDVFPINSEHGTHVSGIIVGNDDVITGVSPNAQLTFMKVFSDETSGAKTSWILAALQDCVMLGVDVINMSLGSSAGFSREVDRYQINEVYDDIAENGISLVAAASNDYNSTHGSEKNGSLGLTSNPDSATVGSPSTYDASLSVASISGVKTHYLISSVTGDAPIYITEGSGLGGEQKKFVEETLVKFPGQDEVSLEYVVVPGVGRHADYTGIDVKDKIALVRRGSTNFEDKARIAKEKGAVACIIYNNVSGNISMSVGAVGDYPVCSISQDDGERLVKAGTGTITISKNRSAGPFMSDFSSWGPTPSLGIKPEITAHGGDIYSSVPGQDYDRQSGTSMAAPNQAGVTALMRQYVKGLYPDISNVEVNTIVNQLMMSTTDIAYNKIGNPYAVRKQGSGLANMQKATTTPAYLRTYNADGTMMNKTKLELGDDKDKTGIYEMTFEIFNMSADTLTYEVGALVQTEGVSATLTNKGLTTVTEEGYMLNGSISVLADGASGKTVTVAGHGQTTVTVTLTLSAADKQYLNEKFANGMYVEGFVTLDAKNGTEVDLNVPYLAFYGDWTQAPLFDIDYFETNKDELDDAIDTLDKTLPDAYATTPLGGLYNDYIARLGAYAYVQAPNATKISASRDYIALSNQDTGETGTGVNSIYSIYAGMLRGAKRMEIEITDAVTGEVIFSKTETNQRKSYGAGSSIYPSPVDIDFNMSDYDLKNNSRYNFKMTGYLDYEDGGINTNLKNTFEFPFVVDFQAPTLTDVQFRTEYDKDTQTYRLYADMSVYDNHYSQGAVVGYIYDEEPNSQYAYGLGSFGRYVTPIYSQFNTTSILSYELTNYMDEIKNSYNGNSFIVQLYDYAQNMATYEVNIPDSVVGVRFEQEGEQVEEITLNVNETYVLNEIIKVSPDESWIPSLNFVSSNERIAKVVNGKVIGLSAGETTIKAVSNADANVFATLKVKVAGDFEYDKPVADNFVLTGYTVNKVFYFSSSSDQDLGTDEAGRFIDFTTSYYSLKMYPSESVTIAYDLLAYFPDLIKVEYLSSNDAIARVTADGTIVAQAEGNTSISVRVLMYDSDTGRYESTLYSQSIDIEVKDPYNLMAFYLYNYYGLGGEVVVPGDLGIKEINAYAFSNTQYVPKGEGDVIDEEDPYATKPTYIGDNTITKVVLPEGVEVIGAYAFAGLTALTEIVLPSTLTKIQNGAFYNCISLTKVSFSGANNLKFVNNKAFMGCKNLNAMSFDSIIAIGDDGFNGTALTSVSLPKTAQSIGKGAFANCSALTTFTIGADKVKLGSEAFAKCVKLTSINVNASVVPAGVFSGCKALESVTLGKDVAVVGSEAFRNTKVSSFTVVAGNPNFSVQENGGALLSADGTTVVLVAPTLTSYENSNVTKVADGAFSGNVRISKIALPNVTEVGAYAFAKCNYLGDLTLGALEKMGERAFYETSSLKDLPVLADTLEVIPAYAFCKSGLRQVTLPNGVTVGEAAFAECQSLKSVKIGNDVTLGKFAFMAYSYAYTKQESYTPPEGMGDSYTAYYRLTVDYSTLLTELVAGENVTFGESSFQGAEKLTTVTLGAGAKIGTQAFYNCKGLTKIDLSEAKSVGNSAFSGDRYPICYYDTDDELQLFAYEDELLPAEDWADGFATPKLRTLDLSSCTTLGDYAFSATPIESMILGDGVTEIAYGVFYQCRNLQSAQIDGVKKVGDYAFADASSLAKVDLNRAEIIGEGAFTQTALTEITLKNGVEIGANAFRGNKKLATVHNLNKAEVIGAYAFAYTALTEADLSSATEIGDFAFGYSAVKSVKLGNDLQTVGENPFVECEIGAFEQIDMGDNVKVIDGVLYRVATNGGLELVTYPINREGNVYTTADNTVRISAGAFVNSKLISVTLGHAVAAIGDKAFYNCENLTVVVFKSLKAPVLEEQYDYMSLLETDDKGVPYFYHRLPNLTELTYTNGQKVTVGLGIVKYKLWNWAEAYTNYFYGANFVDIIGGEKNKTQTLLMVRPSNGMYYDTFIYSQYFDGVSDGMLAPSEATLNVISLIQALPERVTLADEDSVNVALSAFNALSLQQKLLVQGEFDGTDYYNDVLYPAVRLIEYLKNQENGDTPVTPEEPVENDSDVGLYITIGVLAVIIAGLAVTMVLMQVSAKKKAQVNAEETSVEEMVEQSAQENEEE